MEKVETYEYRYSGTPYKECSVLDLALRSVFDAEIQQVLIENEGDCDNVDKFNSCDLPMGRFLIKNNLGDWYRVDASSEGLNIVPVTSPITFHRTTIETLNPEE